MLYKMIDMYFPEFPHSPCFSLPSCFQLWGESGGGEEGSSGTQLVVDI